MIALRASCGTHRPCTYRSGQSATRRHPRRGQRKYAARRRPLARLVESVEAACIRTLQPKALIPWTCRDVESVESESIIIIRTRRERVRVCGERLRGRRLALSESRARNYREAAPTGTTALHSGFRPQRRSCLRRRFPPRAHIPREPYHLPRAA